MSMCRSLSCGTFLRSSSFIRWIGLLPTTPGTRPVRVEISTRCPTRMIGSQPPTPVNQRNPSSSMWWTIRPISSMCPTTASDRPGGSDAVPGTLATVEPTASWLTSAKAPAASRNAVAGACSYPEGPAAVISVSRVSGMAIGGAELSDAPSAGHQLPQHELQDAAVLVVLALLEGVDAHRRRELGVASLHRHLGRVAAVESGDRDLLLAREAERLRGLALGELQRQHAHAHEVRAVDALEGLRDHGPHAQQVGALGGPVAGGARAVLLARQHDERRALVGVAHRRVVDRQLLLLGELQREPADQLLAGDLVAQADVGERAAHHHLMVAAAGAVGVEVLVRDPVLVEVA